jgi:ATP-dependent Clp protease ATP-binding subunit ClpX
MRIRPLKCSFCGKGEAEVAKLVAGPKVFICDACVAIAVRVMKEEPGPPVPQPRGLWRRLLDWIAGGLGRSEYHAVSS